MYDAIELLTLHCKIAFNQILEKDCKNAAI